MANKKIYPIIAFLSIYIIHFSYVVYGYWRVQRLWADVGFSNAIWLSYFYGNDYLMGFAYALAGAFTVYAVSKYFKGQKEGAKGATVGIAITGLLYFGGCFLIGCCGSPMLSVYLSLFGSSFLGFTKPLVALITVISVALSYFWMNRQGNDCNCVEGECKIKD